MSPAGLARRVARRALPLRLRLRAKRLARRLFPTPSPDGKLRLNLGCGVDYRPGYVNIDLSPSADCDMHLDFAEVGRVFPPGSVAEVLMIQSFVYHPLWQARQILRDLHQLLEPGGRLILELCDLSKCAQRLIDTQGDLHEYIEALRCFYAFDQEMVARRRHYTPAAIGWTAWHLRYELEQAGFSQITIGEPQTHKRRVWRDMRVEAVK